MVIRKLFRFENSHRVINCSTERCKKSFHGHSYVCEVFIKGNKLDNAGMLCDFSLTKNIKQFIDSFDHCHCLWDQDSEEAREAIKKLNDRWIELPMNPSAENLALFICYECDKIIKATEFNNGEGELSIAKVIVHETTTGYAEATLEDANLLLPIGLNVTWSEGVTRDWSPELFTFIMGAATDPEQKYFTNPIIED